jgi:peptidoglycan-associated lipoprotein
MSTLIRQIAGSGRVLFPLTVVLTSSVTVELLSSITHERDPAIRDDSAFVQEKTHIKAVADSGNPSRSFMRKSQSLASTGRMQSHFQNARLLKTVYVPIKRSVLQPKTSKLQIYRISSSNSEPKTAENQNSSENHANMVFFSFDSAELRASAFAKLEKQVALLKADEMIFVTIEGHTDELGTREYNLGLGNRRANQVKDYYIASGIDENRIKTISYGKERPLMEGSNTNSRSKNRRAVTIAFYKPSLAGTERLAENEVARKKSVEKQTTENATKKITSNAPNNSEMTKPVKKAKPMSIASRDKFYIGVSKQVQTKGSLGWEDVGAVPMVTSLTDFRPSKNKSNNVVFGYRKGNVSLGLKYSKLKAFKLKASPASIAGFNYNVFTVPVTGHSYSADIGFHIPIRDDLEFVLSAGLGQAELMTGFAGVDGTHSVDRKYKNISVGVKNMGVGVDYYLSPTLVFSAGMTRSEYEDFGITLDPAGSANLLAKEMKIDSINLGFKKYF